MNEFSALHVARQSVEAHPDGRLEAGLRRVLLLGMGPRRDRPWEELTAAHTARAWLALAVANRVLPIWERTWPRRRIAADSLKRAELCLASGKDLFSMKRVYGTLNTYVDDLRYEIGPCPQLDVGDAIARAILVVALDETLVAHELPSSARDPLPDPVKWDTSFVASESYAAFSASDAGVLTACRRAFWRTYLDEDVPRALSILGDGGGARLPS